MRLDDAEVRRLVAAVEGLLGRVGELPEPARETALDAVQAIVEMYGEALGRFLDLAAREGDGLLGAARSDELLGHLLILHDLEPASLEERVRAALDGVRPALGSHGGGVTLLGVEGDRVRLRLEGSCDGCRSSAQTLRHTVEEAIRGRAPEIERVEVEEAAGDVASGAGGNGFVPLTSLRREAAAGSAAPASEAAE
ncbi:MAG TPA: NifU family protein [Thermoanaerobaculia bacterium]|nr:NifU family protein [Thermoanaerobaculia bacterium]